MNPRESPDDIRDIHDLFREILNGVEPESNPRTRRHRHGDDEYELPRVRVESREYDDEFLVAAEFLGFGREAIEYDVDGERLEIRAENAGRSYSESVAVPSGVDVTYPDESYSNGVLEISFEKE